jgi:hypothetical protein
MFQNTHRVMTTGIAILLLASIAAGREALVIVEDLGAFTHVAYVPVGSDLSSITFRGLKAVKVATTKRKSVADTRYCKQAASRDPGGSIDCPRIQEEAPSPAYQVTYSFDGQPIASDEYGSKYFTFSVYFRPEELSPAVREALSQEKGRRANLAALFNLTTSRDLQQRVVVDDENSTFGEGTYVDGIWSHTNPRCEDNVRSMTITVPVDYIAVRVDPVSSRVEQPAIPPLRPFSRRNNESDNYPKDSGTLMHAAIIDLSGRIAGTASIALNGRCVPFPTVNATGTGFASGLGDFVDFQSHCTTSGSSFDQGTFELTSVAQSDNSLFGTHSGTASMQDGLLNFRSTLLVAGGTGAFSDASGTVSSSGTLNERTGAFSASLSGSVTTAPERAAIFLGIPVSLLFRRCRLSILERVTKLWMMWKAIPFERLTRPYAPLVGSVRNRYDEPDAANFVQSLLK